MLKSSERLTPALRYRPGRLKPDSSAQAIPSLWGRLLTVCTAAKFSWNYSTTLGAENAQFGPAIIAAADRMLSDDGLGIEYEPPHKWKAAIVTRTHLVLIAGAMVVNSEVVYRLHKEVMASPEAWTTRSIADLWSSIIRTYTREDAAKLYLSPLNLDGDTFIQQSRLLEPSLVIELSNQMQGHRVEAEALVAGCDGNEAHLYFVNNRGIVTCHDDIGFVSIGSGGIHASGHYMLEEFSEALLYYDALFATFSAKKKAEVAPAVGSKHTDMFVITRDGTTKVPDHLVTLMGNIYNEHLEAKKAMVKKDIRRIMEADTMVEPSPTPQLLESNEVSSTQEATSGDPFSDSPA